MQTNSFKSYRWIWLVLALLLLGMLVLAPLLMIFWTSLYPDQRFDLQAPLRNIMQSDLSEVLFNSIWLGLCVITLTTVLAFPLAWIMAKTELRRHKWLDIVLLIPFMTPPYIGSMGWMLFMQTNGYMEKPIMRVQKVDFSAPRRLDEARE